MFEAMIISAGGVWLALFVLLFIGSLIWASELDSIMFGTAIIIIGAFIAQFVFSIPIWASIVANPLVLVMYLAVYISIGLVYAKIWKLPNFMEENSRDLMMYFNSWVRDKTPSKRDLNTNPDYKMPDLSFNTFLASNSNPYSVQKNADRVASWVLLWPASMLWELSHKPFRWIWKKIYYGIGELLENTAAEEARKIYEKNKKNDV